MFNLLLVILFARFFYLNHIKTGKFKQFVRKILPWFIMLLQRFVDKIDGRTFANHQYNNQRMSIEEARQILGVSHNASKDEIMLAFKKLMLINHPDKGGSAYITTKIITAKEILIRN